jgi:hypothetical protein
VDDAHRIFNVDLEGNAGSGFHIEFPGEIDLLQYTAAKMFLHQEQDNVPLCLQGQAEKGFADLQPLSPGVVNDSGPGSTRVPRRIHHGVGFTVLDKYDNHFEMHDALLTLCPGQPVPATAVG